MTNKDSKYVDLSNARNNEQRSVMEEIVLNAECPFCIENLRKYHKMPILKEGTHWVITNNQWPYKKTKQHFILISKIHATRLSELPPEAGAELITLLSSLEEEYGVLGGAFAMRFGETSYSAATVEHIHAHFIEPDISQLTEDESVTFYIGKSKK